jgi:hypothetical protein
VVSKSQVRRVIGDNSVGNRYGAIFMVCLMHLFLVNMLVVMIVLFFQRIVLQ